MWRRWLIVFALVTAFLFLRFYRLHDSLIFFNDIGRDLLVLWDWKHTGKPPLLGPQTSALPFNQSVLYFYLLAPLGFLTNFSPWSAIYTGAIFYLAIFGFLFWWTRKNSYHWRAVAVLFFLTIIHPQVIIQNRFVWNPTFVLPSLALAFWAWIKLREKWDWKYLATWAGALAFAVSMNYSAIPGAAAFLIYSMWVFRKKSWWLWASLASAFGVFNALTLVFEMRHGFLLTNMLMHKAPTAQFRTGIFEKLVDLQRDVFPWEHQLLGWGVLLATIGVVGYLLWKKSKNYQLTVELQSALSLFVITLATMLLLPVGVQTHYIFAIVTMFFLVVALLPFRFSWLITCLLTAIWVTPSNLHFYFAREHRTVDEMVSCVRSICAQEKEPIFVSVQGDYVYHSAPEFHFLLKQAGCNVKDIYTENGTAQKMVVMLDNSTFTPGQTNYYELSLFGGQKLGRTYRCTDNLGAQILQR